MVKKTKVLAGSQLADIMPSVLLLSVGILFVGLLLWWRLESLLPGLHQIEFGYQQAVASEAISLRESVTRDPLFAPYTFGLYVLQVLGLSTAFAIRSIGAVFGLLSVMAFYLIVKRWHTRRVALYMTVLYASSAGLLHFARFADSATSYLLLVPILAALVVARELNRPLVTLLVYVIGGFVSVFIPGFVWLLLISAFWQRRTLTRIMSKLKPTALGSLIFLMVLIAGAIISAVAYNFDLFYVWLGLPAEFPSLVEVLKRFVSVPFHFFISGPDDPARWVGLVGIVDIFVSALFLLGSFAYFFQRKLDRAKILYGLLAVFTILYSLGGPVSMMVMLPIVYLIASAGLALLFQQWFTVFPRNPFARGAAILLISATTGLAIFYNTHHYFVAWPKTPATRAVFQQPPQ
jgi:hypothetical protein